MAVFTKSPHEGWKRLSSSFFMAVTSNKQNALFPWMGNQVNRLKSLINSREATRPSELRGARVECQARVRNDASETSWFAWCFESMLRSASNSPSDVISTSPFFWEIKNEHQCCNWSQISFIIYVNTNWVEFLITVLKFWFVLVFTSCLVNQTCSKNVWITIN